MVDTTSFAEVLVPALREVVEDVLLEVPGGGMSPGIADQSLERAQTDLADGVDAVADRGRTHPSD